jgi:hypothetical protein
VLENVPPYAGLQKRANLSTLIVGLAGTEAGYDQAASEAGYDHQAAV